MNGLEDRIQANIVKALRVYYPNSLVFAVPNGGGRSAATGAILKATGVLAGVSDLVFVHQGHVYFIEVKTEGGKQSPAQQEFERRIHAQGLTYWLVRSAEEVFKKLDKINI